ncbi:MAG: hypothetical protein LWY06_02555 [Firmicutes bacterium]|nr:hypothetical protein [Bacillota bacterium]
MKKSVCFLITLTLVLWAGLRALPVFAVEISDIHSLFYIRQSVSYYDFILLVFIVLLWIGLAAAVMAGFSLIISGLRVSAAEAFLVDRLSPVKAPGGFISGHNLITPVLSVDVAIGGNKAAPGGVSIVRYPEGGEASGVMYDVISKLFTGWKKPVIYWGRNQKGMLSGIIAETKPGREEIRKIAEVLTRGVLIAPILEPDPAGMSGIVKKALISADAGALIIEDPGNGFLRNYLSADGRGMKLRELSEAFRLPVFIITDDELLNENTIS